MKFSFLYCHFVPSGATDIVQPLDVGVFGQLKNSVQKKSES